MRLSLLVIVFTSAIVTSCATQYERDLMWCQENTFGIDQERCKSAALRKAQRNERLLANRGLASLCQRQQVRHEGLCLLVWHAPISEQPA